MHFVGEKNGPGWFSNGRRVSGFEEAGSIVKPEKTGKITPVKALQYSVVVLPKLDNEEELRRLREQYDPTYYQLAPYVPMVLPFTPATLEELQAANDFISQTRRKLHPWAVDFRNCVESEDRLLLVPASGGDELVRLHEELHGAQTMALIEEPPYAPLLVLAKIPDPERRQEAKHEVGRLGRTLGVVDSLSLLGAMPSGEIRLVAHYPFGIGRVDYYDRLLP